MPRKKVRERKLPADHKYASIEIMRLINYIMCDGKKNLARKIVYKSLELIKEKTNEDPLAIFEKAKGHVTPKVEVKAKRLGGSNVLIPKEVTPKRQMQLFLRIMITAARERQEKSMEKRLANEFIEASQGEGNAVKRKTNMDKAAHSHRAYAHLK